MGTTEKTRFLAISILDADGEASVINRKGIHSVGQGIDFPPIGQFEGIDYYYTSGTIYRPSSFF